MSGPTEEEIARFMKYVKKLPNGCWFWTGGTSCGKGNKLPYASFWYRGKTIRGHVFAHDHLAGKEHKPGNHRDHECDFSLCVCPDHIHSVSPEKNNERRWRDGKCKK